MVFDSGVFASGRPFLGIQQSRNRGHQNAVLAGLMTAKDHCDVTISIDADGQDDLNAMNDMLTAYEDGCEVVYGVRSDRKSDSWFKRVSAQSFYRFLRLMGVDVVYNHADYRLASSKVLQHLADFKEVNLFLRGMFPLVGFKSTSVYYQRHERLAGKSHYSCLRWWRWQLMASQVCLSNRLCLLPNLEALSVFSALSEPFGQF